MSFACHRKQDVPVLVCINCCSVFHPSCFKRNCKYVNKQQVDKVICCKSNSSEKLSLTYNDKNSLEENNELKTKLTSLEAEKTNLTDIRNKQREENNYLRETNDSLKCELEKVNLENENLRGELDQLKEINLDLSKSNETLRELIERTVDEEYNELLNENRSLKKQEGDLEQEIVDLTTKLSKSEKHLEKYQAQLAELEESLTKALLVNKEDNLKLLQQSEAMNVLRRRVDEKRERSLQLSDDVNKQHVYLRTLKAKHDEKKQDLICKVDYMQEIMVETKQKNNETQRRLNQKLTESVRQNVELMKEIGNLKETLDSSDDRNSSSENFKIKELNKDVSRLQAEPLEANAKITTVQDEVANLQEQNDKLISEYEEVDKINEEILTTIEVLTIESSLKSELDKVNTKVCTSDESIETTSQCTIVEEELTSTHEQLGENIEEKLYQRIYYRLRMGLLEELSQQRPVLELTMITRSNSLGTQPEIHG